jgi:hypothetical protein
MLIICSFIYILQMLVSFLYMGKGLFNVKVYSVDE